LLEMVSVVFAIWPFPQTPTPARTAGRAAAQYLCAGHFTQQATCQFRRRFALLWLRYCMAPGTGADV